MQFQTVTDKAGVIERREFGTYNEAVTKYISDRRCADTRSVAILAKTATGNVEVRRFDTARDDINTQHFVRPPITQSPYH